MNLVFDRLRGLLGGIASAALLLTVAPTQAQTVSATKPFSTLMFFSGVSPTGNVTVGHDGALYGPTSPGGGAFVGLFYRLAADASSIRTIYQYGLTYDANFERIFLGAQPSGQMLLASDGYFYGTTQSTNRFGGSGTIYRMEQSGAGYTKLYEFAPVTVEYTRNSIGYAINNTGFRPTAPLIEGIVGGVGGVGGVRYLFGSTQLGGLNGTGVIFRFRLDNNEFTVLHHFAEAAITPVLNSSSQPTFTPPPENYPIVNFVTNPDGRLVNGRTPPFGTTDPVVENNNGGVNPNRRLLLVGNVLYGTTTNGGAYGTGVVFKLNADGTGFRSTSFAASPKNIDAPPENPDPSLPPPTDPRSEYYGNGKRKLNETGSYPASSLVQIGNDIYGTTSAHGAYPAGSVDPTNPTTAPPTSPTAPRYSSSAGYGTMFRFDSNSATPVIEVVFDFTGGENNSLTVAPRSMPSRPGSDASGDLIVINGTTIVGTTQTNGILIDATAPTNDTSGVGSVYKFDTAATTDPFSSIFVFGGGEIHTGAFPSEGVVAVPEGTDYAYYGVTPNGGAWGQGTVFKLGTPVNGKIPGTPEPYDDGGGSMGKWLIAALILLAALQLIMLRHRRSRLKRVLARQSN
jgi:uncharacterized repeat protein (TIGR03803 family)